MAALWGKANLKTDFKSSLDGESFEHMKKKLWDLQSAYIIRARDVAGETAELSLYQRIPQLLGRPATGVLLSGMKTEESSKADPSHRSAFRFHSPMTEKEGFTSILKQRGVAAALARLPPGGTRHTKQGHLPHSSKVEFCLHEPTLCFRRRDSVKRQQHQFCIHAGLSKRG